MKENIQTIAVALATTTANKATDLATTAIKTAADLATKTAETNAVIRTNMEWMKKSLEGIEIKLNEMDKVFVTATQHAEVLAFIKDHEDRLRGLEQKTWIWVGGLAILTFAIPILLKVFFKV